MTAYVRVRKHDELVQRIDDTGTQVDIAAAAGLSTQRVNQLYTGAHQIIEVRKARRLEDALGVCHGTYFEAVDAPLLAPYVLTAGPEGDPDPGDSEPDAQPPPVVGDAPPASAQAPPTVSASAA